MTAIRELIQEGKTRLKDLSDTHLEVKLILLKCLSLTEEQLLTSLDRNVSKAKLKCFNRLISKRLTGIPIPYITGFKEFWSLPFRVSPGVLIPRPETELLVEKVLAHSTGEDEFIVDIGTGCGNIAVSLASELPRARILATDDSRKALRAARMNASLRGISSVVFARGHMFSPLARFRLDAACDFIVSNPPYVAEEEWLKLSSEIRDHEPKSALVAGENGLEVIRQIIQGAPVYLKPDGILLIEIGSGQRDGVFSIFNSSPVWKDVIFYKDLAGIERVVSARKSVPFQQPSTEGQKELD